MITRHLYLNTYPVERDSKTLILGTIHPHNTEGFQIPFFYGNKNSLWNLLSDACPQALPKPITLDGVLFFLEKRKIAISDTIRQCRRLNPTALDQDLIPEVLNYGLLEQIQQSKIERILCTSAFGKNNAFKLFYEDMLNLKITQEIRSRREVLLKADVFGRPVIVKALFSPSGSSNISLSKHPLYLNNKGKYINSSRPVYDFKVDYYRSQFQCD